MLWWWLSVALSADVEGILVEELARATKALSSREIAPHYTAITAADEEWVKLGAVDGGLRVDQTARRRRVEVDLRVGTPDLDNTHPLRGESGLDGDDRGVVRAAWGGPEEAWALRSAVWRELDRSYREAEERLVLVRSERSVRVEEEDAAPDFEPRAAVVHRAELPALEVDAAAWRDRVRALSAALVAEAGIIEGEAGLEASRAVTTFVDSEGSRVVDGRVHARLSLQATAVAADGDRVVLFQAFDAHAVGRLPDQEELLEAAAGLARDAIALAAAPRATPYTGPVLLSGRAAAVFVHEVMGHRVEGHRQKSDSEGKTFLDYLGRPVLPAFIDVFDDPTVAEIGGVDLNGWYRFDDEGVPAQRASLVEDGVFKGFLMGRSPLEVALTSNGHGRRSAGHWPTSRMANTIVSSSKLVSEEELRRQFRVELKAQGLPFGYRVGEIDGGFTFTGRSIPNAFNVTARRIWRVYADGRPDELVRGLDLVGTPLGAFQSVLATGGAVEVFNGVCGAESGWVPVSGVAPSMLFRRLELQLQDKSSERPPLRPRPVQDGSVEATW
jgi:predicted Zn-dependent protease